MTETPRFAVALAGLTLVEVEGLVRIPLLMVGTWYKGQRKFTINAADVASIFELFHTDPKGEIVIDYDHASEFPDLAQGGPIPAAGWLKSIEEAADKKGVLWGWAKFTERAQKMIAAGEYKYLSPMIEWGDRDKKSGRPLGAQLRSMGLTNRPFLSMPALQMVASDWTQMNADFADQKTKEKTMTKVTLTDSNGQATVVCGECGKETGAAVELPAKPKVVRLSDVKRTKDGRFDFAGIDTSGDVLVAGEVFHAQRVEEALQRAVTAGRILPAQRAAYEKLALSDLPAFEALVESMKPQVDLAERGLGGNGTEGGAATEERQLDDRIRDLSEKRVAAEQAGGRTITYGQAMKLVLNDHPDLEQQKKRLIKSA